jgi:DNA-binding PadR family transcriptional regulator
MSVAHARDAIVLAIIKAHPAHGYDIAVAVERGALKLTGLKRPNVYAVLARLHARGWVSEKNVEGNIYPDRKVYHITEAGAAALPAMIDGLGDLPVLPLMSLTMLHDAGEDIQDAARAQLKLRQAALDDLPEPAHGQTATSALARGTLQAEIEVLAHILG